MYFKQIKDFVKSINKNDTKTCWIQLVKDMKMTFHSCLETNSSGIGIARGPRCSICKVCSNLVHCIDGDNSNIALLNLDPDETPPIAITPLPVGDVTIACLVNSKGRFGPEI